MITIVRLPVNDSIASELVAAGVKLMKQDFASTNTRRINQAEASGHNPFEYRKEIADTGKLALKFSANLGEAVSVLGLLRNLGQVEVFLQKVDKSGKPARFFLVIRQIEDQSPTTLPEAAKSLIAEILMRHYLVLHVWANLDGTMTVNPSCATQEKGLTVWQVKLSGSSASLE